jgi:hypothetical protein
MCESIAIRYVHLMQHPDYPQEPAVGCICAEHMGQDYLGPRLREKRLRSVARRRASWARRGWNVSARGNHYVNAEGYNLTVFALSDAAGRGWGLKVTHRASGRVQVGKRRYQSEEAAKRAALDALIWAKGHLVD